MVTITAVLSFTASIVINISFRAMAATAGYVPVAARDMLTNGQQT